MLLENPKTGARRRIWPVNDRIKQLEEEQAAWQATDGINWYARAKHVESELLHATNALQQACDLFDADNLTTQTYLQKWLRIVRSCRRVLPDP